MNGRPASTPSIIAAALAASLATGIVVGLLLTTGTAAFHPSMGARWFVTPLVLVPVPLLAWAHRAGRVRQLLAGWNLTVLLVISGFGRAGLVLLVPTAERMLHLVILSLLVGLSAGGAALLHCLIAGRPSWWSLAGELALVAVGVWLASRAFGPAGPSVGYYSGAILMVLSAVVSSFTGRADA